MSLSIREEIVRFLTPGIAEDLEKQAKISADKVWLKIAKRIKHSRNAFYIAVALTIIGILGLTLSGFGMPAVIGGAVIIFAGVSVGGIAIKKLRDQILIYQRS